MPRVAGKIATTSPATKAHAYTPAWRLAADTVPLFPLLRPVILFWALPGAAAALVRWACVAQVSGREDTLLLCARDRTIEVPYASIARVVPWRVPLPGPGLSLRLRSGRRVTHGIEVADPAA